MSGERARGAQGWITLCQGERDEGHRVLAVLDNQKLSFYEGEEGAAANAEPVLRITLTSELVVTRELPESGAKQSLRVRSSAGEVYLVGEEDGVDWNTHLQQAIDGLGAKATEGRASTAPTVATAGGERGEKAPGVGARAGSARGVGPAQPQPQAQAAASKATPWGETGAKLGGMSKKDSEMSAAEQALTAASVGGGSSVRAPEPVGRSDTLTQAGSRPVSREISMRRRGSEGMSEAQAALEERTEDGDRMMGWVRMAKKKYFAVLNTRELELYLSNTDLQSGKPPKEVVALTPDCTVESRKLAASAKPRPPASSSEGGHVSPFGEGGEPDSVIDLQMTASKTGSPRVVTLQCFSVEEENKWISHLQIAIGSMMGPLPKAAGGGDLHGKAPRMCCTVS